jgi:hypothetical protein
MTHEERRQRAIRSEQLLNNQDFIEAMADAEEHIISDWRSSAESAQREMCWMKLQALEAVQKQLRAYVDDALVLHSRVANRSNQ